MKLTQLHAFCICSLVLLLLASCASDQLKYTLSTDLNPNKIAPLTAMLNVDVNRECSLTYTVNGASPITKTVAINSGENQIPVLGLYAGQANKISLKFDDNGVVKNDSIVITTAELPNYFPIIDIVKLDRKSMEEGMHLADLHFANNGKFDSRPTLFDDQGKIRWYLDLSFFGNMLYPINLTSEGNFRLGGQNSIYEFDRMGKIVKHIELSKDYKVHHEVIEILDGKIMAAITKKSEEILVDGKMIPALMDHIALIDRNTSKIIKEWDLADVGDVDRDDLNTMLPKEDWMHMNGIAFNEKDSSIYVSSKNQGLVKIDWDGELEWILSQKTNWGKAGRKADGFDLEPYILTAVNNEGKAYSDDVQTGKVSGEDFDLPWGMHAPLILPNGNVFLLDNGFYRYYQMKPTFSRGVEYKINESDKTVEQVWQYGKERGVDCFSLLISDVDVLPKTNNRLLTFGYVNHFGRIVEVEYPSKNVVFEATLAYKTLNGNRTYAWGQLDLTYRSERVVL